MKIEGEKVTIKLLKTIDEDYEGALVTTYLFDIIDLSGNIVGAIDLRAGLKKDLWLYGHVGYTIYRKYRGQRYAYYASLLILKYARFLKMSEVVFTCNPDNYASKKTIELLGCQALGEIKVPKKHPLYILGDRRKLIYVYIVE